MRRTRSWQLGWMCAALGLAMPMAASADDAGKITVSGLLDWYYQYSGNHPPVGTPLNGRAFDVKNDSFSFSLAEVNLKRNPSPGLPLGFTATLTLGKTADIVHATEPGGANTYKYLQQLYTTYTTQGKKPLTVDFGKFVTMMGYEVIESSSNDNYSRSLLFTYAIPFYHAGFRLTYPFTPTLTGQLHLVNGWNDVEDDNGGKSVGAELAWTPSPKWSWTLNWMGGNEGSDTQNAAGLYGGIGFTTPGVRGTSTLDLVGVWNPTAKLKLGVNGDYASASGTNGGNWSGEAIYARYQLTNPLAVALRAEHFEDSAGIRTGAAQNLNEITATLEYVVKGNWVNRLEFRHDHAGTKFFPSGGGASNDQDTITYSQVLKF